MHLLRLLPSLLLILFSSTPLTTATAFTISVPPSTLLPNPSILPASTTASLTTLSHTYTSTLTIRNDFSFRNVSAGSYLLTVHCASHAFAPLRVDVGDDGSVAAWRTFRGNEWGNKGESVVAAGGGKEGFVLDVRVLGAKEYYMERSGFSPLSLLKNPMILVAGFGMLMVFGMPYLLDNMDPELRAEFDERQKASPVSGLIAGQQSGTNPIASFDAAAWLAGSGKKSGEATTAEKGVTR